MSVALLLIGWANALNLTVARFLERGREFGLRKVFGASHCQIIIQGLLESGFYEFVGYTDSLWLAGTPFYLLFYRWVGQNFGTDILILPAFWGNGSQVVVIGTFVVGLLPLVADGFYTSVGDYEGKTVAWQTWQPDKESTDCNSIFDFFLF